MVIKKEKKNINGMPSSQDLLMECFICFSYLLYKVDCKSQKFQKKLNSLAYGYQWELGAYSQCRF